MACLATAVVQILSQTLSTSAGCSLALDRVQKCFRGQG